MPIAQQMMKIQAFTNGFSHSLIHFYSKAVLTFDIRNLALDKVEPVSAEMMEEYKNGKSRSVPVNLVIAVMVRPTRCLIRWRKTVVTG